MGRRVYFLAVLCALMAAAMAWAGDAPAATQPGAEGSRVFRPTVYKDGKTGVILYVETNGRVVSAVDGDGNLLWSVNPLAEAKAKGGDDADVHVTRVVKPQDWMVNSISPGKGNFAEIDFNNNELGIINLKTGEFSVIHIRMR